jgi:hypothetical protein
VGKREVYTDLGERDNLEDLGESGATILKEILKKWYEKCLMDCSASGWEKVMDCSECSNEPSGFVECAEFLD